MSHIELPDSCIKWRCCECGDLHDDERGARNCCEPRIEEVFLCPVCGERHDDEDDAIECCDYDPNREPDASPPLTAAELEAMGQQRLFA